SQAGWSLQSFQCRAEGAVWRCQARYRRGVPLASAAAFMAQAWPEWQVQWDQFDEAVVRFDIDVDRHPLELAALRHSGAGLIPDADALQTIRPLLRTMRVDEPRPVEVEPPRTASGAQLPRPPSMPQVAARELTLEAPLRS